MKFGVSAAKFNPLAYLDHFTAAAYLEPEGLRRRQPVVEAPFPVQRGVSEVFKLARRWDFVERLRSPQRRCLRAAGRRSRQRGKTSVGTG